MKSAPAVSRSNNRRKRSPPKGTPAPSKDKKTTTAPLRERNSNQKNTIKPPTSDLVIGQVKILKRGEVLPAPSLSAGQVKEVVHKEKKAQKVGATSAGGLDDLVIMSKSDRVVGSKPCVVPKNIKISDFYAGSAFITSPEPSSLPVPVFFKKKDLDLADGGVSDTDYDATSDLRRLLRLDFS